MSKSKKEKVAELAKEIIEHGHKYNIPMKKKSKRK